MAITSTGLTKQEVLDLIAERLPDNTTNLITAHDLRVVLCEILQSSYNEVGTGLLRTGEGGPTTDLASVSAVYVDSTNGRLFTSDGTQWISIESLNVEVDLGTTTSQQFTVDLSQGSIFIVTITQDVVFNVTNAVPGKEYVLVMTQDAIGGHSVQFTQSDFLFENGSSPNPNVGYPPNAKMELRFQLINGHFHSRFVADYASLPFGSSQ
ncbi:MAG: hypothetical protein ACPGJS_05535 [Flammeovirgaceae bacterium]